MLKILICVFLLIHSSFSVIVINRGLGGGIRTGGLGIRTGGLGIRTGGIGLRTGLGFRTGLGLRTGLGFRTGLGVNNWGWGNNWGNRGIVTGGIGFIRPVRAIIPTTSFIRPVVSSCNTFGTTAIIRPVTTVVARPWGGVGCGLGSIC
jgi:hypothetical protein